MNQYQYETLKNLVEQKSKDLKSLGKINYDLNSLENIIKYFNKNELKIIDAKICSVKTTLSTNIYCSPEKIVFKEKYFNLYKKFVMVNETIIKLLHEHFGIYQKNEDISYINKNEEDFIIIKNNKITNSNNTQNLILIGIIDKNKNELNIKHILEYKDKNILESELTLILKMNFSNYLKNKISLNPQNQNEFISPIFNNDKIIGNYYKYIKDFDYNKCFDYSKYLNNKLLLNAIYLYTNELCIKNKLKSINSKKDEYFYLIK